MSGDDREAERHAAALLRALYGDGRGVMLARFGVEDDQQRTFSYPLEISDAARALVTHRAQSCALRTSLYRDAASARPSTAAAFVTELAELLCVGATPPYAWKIPDEDLYVGVWPFEPAPPDAIAEAMKWAEAEMPDWIELPTDLRVRRVEVNGRAAALGRAIEQGERLVRSEVAGAESLPSMTHTLADLLNAPARNLRWTVEGLQVAGGNTMLVAPAKAGKTTLALNLVQCLVDGTRFLDRFDTDLGRGRVAYLNYEVTEAQMLSWFRDLGIKRADRIVPESLRGRSALLTSPDFVDHMVDRLAAQHVIYLVVDPLARAHDANENDNTEISRVLEAVDELKHAAGIRDVLLVHHTGHEQNGSFERARGASRLKDWPDATWTLKHERHGRTFKAVGRDVDLAPLRLEMDQRTRRLSAQDWKLADGPTGPATNSSQQRILDVVGQSPGIGAGELRKLSGMNYADAGIAKKALLAAGRIVERKSGTHHRYYLAGEADA